MRDEQQDAPDESAADAAEGVSAEQLMDIPGPPDPGSANMEGPQAVAEERARQAAEAGAAAATGERDGEH